METHSPNHPFGHSNNATTEQPVPENTTTDSSNPSENNPPDLQNSPENHLPKTLKRLLAPESTLENQLTDSLMENYVEDISVPLSENHLEESQNHPPEENAHPAKKRRRRKKQFPEMIPSAAAVNGLRVLRPHAKSSIYSEKLMDEIIQMQINDNPSFSKNRRRKIADLAKEIDVEALIAISVGFPVDSLTEEEIESNVVPLLGGVEQANYIVIRNHILARWRSNVSVWMTREHTLESIRSEHRGLVSSAYSFLLEHGYINFGLAPSIKEANLRLPEGAERANVIIVGSGLAGLAAARHLISFGFKVVILEGRNRPGGRVLTRKMIGEGVVAAADLGGSILTGINGNPLGVLARQLGYPLHKVRDICPLYLPNGKAVNSELDSRVEVTFNKLLDKVCKLRQEMMDEVKSVDVSLGTALEAFRRVYKVSEDPQEQMLLNWHLANLEYANATMLSNLSMAFWDQDDPYEMGGDHCFIPGGNGRFIRALSEDLPIFYDRTVKSIQYGIDGVMVHAGGQVFRGDMVLCTVPLGVLKRGSIEFVPELPQRKKDAIERIGFGLLNKVAMLFPYDFWGGGIDTFGHLTDDSRTRGEFFLFYSYCSVSGGPLLVALVAGESAIKFEMMSPVDTVGRVLDILRGIFAPKGIDVPNPVQVVCTRWGKDQFTYGSYSYVAVGASGDDYDVLAENVGDGRVFFAGEATNRRYPATMHGAFLSGLREAANILRVDNRRSLVPVETRNNVREENGDLDELFETPDMSFGSFSVLFDPISVGLDSTTLLQVGFGAEKLVSGSLFLYGLISRKQVMELSEVDGDENRMRGSSSSSLSLILWESVILRGRRMSRPLHRGVSGGRIAKSNCDYWDSQMKDRMEKDDVDRCHSSNHSPLPLRFLLSLNPNNSSSKSGIAENGFGSDLFTTGISRSRQNLTLLFLKFSLVLIVILALSGSLWWTISISTTSRGNIFRGYRRLQEQLLSDLSDIGEISLGPARLKELEFCSEESENHIPCYNISGNLGLSNSDDNEYDRQCGHGSRQSCLVLLPRNYRIPLRWPTGRDVIWVANVKITAQEVLSSGSLTKRMMMLEEDQISFRSDSLMFDGVEDYSHQIAEMIGLRNESNFIQAGVSECLVFDRAQKVCFAVIISPSQLSNLIIEVRTVLDIGCGYGSFGAHLFSKQLLTMCIANYEPSGSQVQLTLERGLPAMISSFTKQLPYPSLSFDMLHCARCGIDWDQKEGILLVEVDRVLKPGGYFVWTSPLTNIQRSLHNKENQMKWNFVRTFAENLCWDMLSQQDETVVWKKTSKRACYASRKPGSGPSICSKGHDVESPYYRPLQFCLGGTQSRRWIPIEERTTWPSRTKLNSTELGIYGVHSGDFAEDALNWNSAVLNYWSLLSPLIFSDHPKRPGDEDPSPPFNMLRNVLDMNAHFGGFNSALLEAQKTAWVMNVVPTSGPNYLPLILDRGFVGVLHDWCEAFPTYPRTYDMVHAEGLLSLETGHQHRCTLLDLFTEIDRILRPEGWVILRDTASLIESARALSAQLRWDARVVEIESNSDERLLVCQKPFFKRQQK
ncbi:hypothetical protein HHK36_003993 [Tetracentron sinense]|uniref:SWIRM domain-containing protein n=1 Tax=Tetracentron sinense TaxID=13715 RepID=A0A834ZUE2_TETSI|nr:hypothetical protein HHK36_003993 [Tetracentron sinense]